MRTLSEGMKIEETVAVTTASVRDGSKSQYTRMDLRTEDGHVLQSIYWDGALPADMIKEGALISVRSVVEKYKGKWQLKVFKAQAAEGDISKFLPRVPDDEHGSYSVIVRDFVTRIRTPALRGFVIHCLRVAGVAYMESTAAVTHHHAMVHGLMKHCAEMCQIGDNLIKMYIGQEVKHNDGTIHFYNWQAKDSASPNGVAWPLHENQEGRHRDADLIRAAIPLHDWGKMEEYTQQGAAFTFTNVGKLLSHPGITPWRLAELRVGYNESVAKVQGATPLDDVLFGELLHVIGAHHGKVEYNAPSGPKTMAAIIVHIADYTSCFSDIYRRECYDGLDVRGTWSDKPFATPDGFKNLMRS